MTGDFAAVFAALLAAHLLGDHWVQTHTQASHKGSPGMPGRLACLRHVSTLTLTKLAALTAVILTTGLTVHPLALLAGLAIDAASHYWADRRTTLAHLAKALRKGAFYQMGKPRPGTDDAPHLGTGAYALDQSWHVAWLFIASLIITA